MIPQKELMDEYIEFSQLSNDEKLEDDIIFEKISYFDRKYKNSIDHSNLFEGLLCNIGSEQQSIPVLKFVLKRLDKKKNPSNTQKFNYDYANTLFSIASIEIKHPDYIKSLCEKETFRKAKKHFLNVKKDDTDHFERAYTNISIIYERHGRYYDAIKTYDKVLKRNPSFGMALGGKAISILSFIKNAPEQSLILLNSAYNLLQDALKKSTLVEIGGNVSLQYYKQNIDEISRVFEVQNYKPVRIETPKNISKYQRFVLENDLFLNYDFGYFYDTTSLNDNIFPQLIESLEDPRFEKSQVMSKKSYFTFQIFNQILEDYTSARFSLFNALTLRHKKIDSRVNYVYTYDYTKHSLKYGILKSTFANTYNCLDKIAHLARFYFSNSSLDYTDIKIYFDWFTKKEFKEIIIQNSSLQLLALRDLALDFKPSNIHHNLNKIRNRITHSFLNINADYYSDPKYEHFEITEEHLTNCTKKLLSIVKSALIYLVVAINHTGNRKDVMTMDATMQNYIFK